MGYVLKLFYQDPTDGTPMKAWRCFAEERLPAQQWTLTADGRLVRAGTSECLDLVNDVVS